ncbi:hypothetical protein A3B21_01150 [Candidatus Uhrbacteria bacterium RIFCSPLOWO2_01_FULL_47_24]|uniref:Uncharacterized protein n=1 Tax=Candidatus Uhrbacteria bacterium RIFCSPLOWO2_01_FULL_47_24 TaxID=1802401 RepID=A0A1F7UQI3_9BACT|nr:MAG: hypothetical protein A2753_02060 [Candidatus Uhrbacteria bacterium RIFCSPHIGHO2_01_FULL_47_11]OGL67532.1 MAG: hypothetical protein A3D58_02200 [Candidatus Uhrbacteria bacterium RIFCSPHIGHO2_02_FULL_46_47]OGL76671.1 MAG: hypothetical protein A3F52_03845 [Candidatus Uhrbacteria bacterium RIFCSPHIGHO2_12_FULL_47_11]OGL79994.1 MAG: hypothetical protein A3B21_01150 [Candidatus Uhrbacteria bacterium RIFCSPLOWO2_01_FULL_47_24]OGL84375.1 MAG: hypothetical protein A3J03_00620 [Candidatus Uhrbact
MTKKQTSQAPWYSEETGFFGPGYLKEYGDMLTPEKTLAEVDFIEKTLVLQKDIKILDCPCGHGRHSIAKDRAPVVLSFSFCILENFLKLP